MVYEIAQIDIRPGTHADFEAGVQRCAPLFQRARGCQGMQLQRSVEQPDHYFLVVTWDTVEDHMVHFRESADFQTWRAEVGPYFASPPQVQHTTVALTGF
jgi:heme-degrading monooxygenase HmoA